MHEEEKEETNVVEESEVAPEKSDSSDLDSTFPRESEVAEAEVESEEEEDEEEEDEEEEEAPTPKAKKKTPPKNNTKPQPQPKKEPKKMANKKTEATEQSDHKMIRVSGDIAKRIYQLAAQIQLETGERTHPGDAILFAVEAALK